jgi:hypothetical protein
VGRDFWIYSLNGSSGPTLNVPLSCYPNPLSPLAMVQNLETFSNQIQQHHLKLTPISPEMEVSSPGAALAIGRWTPQPPCTSSTTAPPTACHDQTLHPSSSRAHHCSAARWCCYGPCNEPETYASWMKCSGKLGEPPVSEATTSTPWHSQCHPVAPPFYEESEYPTTGRHRQWGRKRSPRARSPRTRSLVRTPMKNIVLSPALLPMMSWGGPVAARGCDICGSENRGGATGREKIERSYARWRGERRVGSIWEDPRNVRGKVSEPA